MATNAVLELAVVDGISGNRHTLGAQTITGTGTGTLVTSAMSGKKIDLRVVGDIQGFLRFPFADEETLDGMLMPADLKTAQVKLTQGGAGAALALIAEEVYSY
ncbi:MAG TPA: hypothetical protein PL124_10320 [Candidatus Cloacimonadota bacterium]|nr:hypothetical protein [Candidatus Cloacimonadota bacterium]